MPVSSRLARKVPSIRPTVGKFWMPEAERDQPVQELVGDHERVGAVHAREHRRVLDHRQHLARHLADDLVGIAVGHQPRERSAPGSCGSGPSCRSRSGRCRRLPRTWPTGRCRRRRRSAAGPRRSWRGSAPAARCVRCGSWWWAPPGLSLAHARRAPGAVRETSRQASTSASAKASSLMCSGSRLSWRFGPGRKPASSAANSARSASGS